MISAWNIYWVMQLDCISSTVQWFAWMSIIAAAGLGIAHFMADGDYEWLGKRAKQALVFSAAMAFISAFIPSTKTAAAMVILPAVANNQAIQHEAADLYGIAKDALRELAKPKEEGK